MIKNKLKIFHKTTGGTYTELRELDKGTKEVAVTLINTDELLIGYEKPLSQLYIEFKTPASSDAGLTFSQSNGTDYTAVETEDETEGFTQNGFIYLDGLDTAGKVTENSETLNFIKVTNANGTGTMTLYLLDLVFCDMNDLLLDEPDIALYYPEGKTSHINSIIAARNQMIRDVQNTGRYSYDGTSVKLLNQHSFHNIEEVRQPSASLVNHKIYMNLNDSGGGDIYKVKADYYFGKYKSEFKAFMNAMLTLDLDNDGVVDDTEVTAAITSVRLVR